MYSMTRAPRSMGWEVKRPFPAPGSVEVLVKRYFSYMGMGSVQSPPPYRLYLCGPLRRLSRPQINGQYALFAGGLRGVFAGHICQRGRQDRIVPKVIENDLVIGVPVSMPGIAKV